VPPEGPKDAKIAIIGEAPGTWEDRTGRPFMGPAGGVLEHCLHQAGLTRAEVYITNFLKRKPHKNDISPWWQPKKGFTKLGKEACEELYEELKEVKANVLVPLGNCPLYALTGLENITKRRGSIYEMVGTGRKVIPTIHPAACIWTAARGDKGPEGGYIWRHFIAHDLLKARKQSAFPEVKLPQREIIIPQSLEEARHWLDHFRRADRFSFDIEVINYEASMIGFSDHPSRAFVLPFYHRWSEQHEAILWKDVAGVLANPKSVKVGQNPVFDMSFLAIRNNIIVQGRVEDTMCAHHIMYPDFPKGLDFLVSIYTDEPYYKDEGKRWFSGQMVTRDFNRFMIYNGKDAACTLEVWEALEKEMDADYRRIYEDTIELFRPLVFMSLIGIKVDTARLKAAQKEIEEQLRQKQAELDSLCGRHLNVNSPKDIQKYFYVEKGIPPYTKKGAITTDDTAMARIARGTSTRPGLREASLVQEVRGLRKLQGTYLEMQFDEDNRFRASYNPRGTVTGRLSSSKTVFDTGGNAQNLPERFLGFLVADDGTFLISFDLEQAEWVATAYISGDAAMLKVLREGLDPHISTASMMTGLPHDVIAEEDKYVKHLTDPAEIAAIRARLFPDLAKHAKFLPRNMGLRQCGKKANHGLNYGEAYKKFALLNEIPESEAKLIVDSYHSIYPGIRMWYQRVQQQLRNDRTLVGPGPFYRKRRFLGQWGDDLFRKAYAHLPQSVVVDVINKTLKDAYYNREGLECLRHAALVQQVHDSITFRFPLDQLEEAKNFINYIRERLGMELEYEGRTFRIGSEAKVGFNLKDMIKVTDVNQLDGLLEELKKAA